MTEHVAAVLAALFMGYCIGRLQIEAEWLKFERQRVKQLKADIDHLLHQHGIGRPTEADFDAE